MKPNSERAKNAIKALIAVMIGLTVITIAGIIFLYLINQIVFDFDNFEETQTTIVGYSFAIGALTLIQLGIYITTVVLFIMWFRRAYFNLHLLVPSHRLKYSEGWAAGAWFIPIFNLFAPYQIATDLFYESEKLLVENGLMERKPQFHQVKGWWWGLWIASGVVERASSYVNESADMGVTIILSILSLGLSIGAGILAIQMIKNYSQMEILLKKVELKDQVNVPHITNDDLLDSGI